MKGLFAKTLQAMLDGELQTHFGYPKHQVGPKPISNPPSGIFESHRPTGRYPKQVTTEYGEVPLEIPRDRDGSFTPVVVPPHQTTMVGIEDQVIALYARRMSTRDIRAQLADLYGVEISPALVSNITDKLLPRLTEWQQRPLAACYPVVFRDARPK